jgi:aminoglycoside phosphotransferase family enzyme/predicted kinase
MTAATQDLPEALLDPAAYPQAPETVELRETHISWVFLAGERVYKLKKPVKFPFLDYSSLAARREFCHAEIDLGRRFAPSIYEGVVALAPRRDGGLAIAPEDDAHAVEYAVMMRRFDEADTLAAKLQQRAGSELKLMKVGAAVAAFHRDAPIVDAPAPEALAAVVEETLTALAEAGAPARRLESLARFCRAALRAFAPVLAERAAAGLVRDGHGDLRAEHILLGARVEAVDGVEFDPGLRIADVGYDFAFLVMDVAGFDDDLARELVRGYHGDPGPPDLLDCFCAIRALVRAKVDFLRAAQLSGADAHERSARALDRLALAERFAWRVRLPRLVCVTGLPASGKSTLAEAVATVSARPLLSSDRIRKLRAGIDPFQRAAPSAYTDAESRVVYEELGQRAVSALRRDGGVIVDATFRRAADANAFLNALSHSPQWIVCEAPPAVLLERAQARAARGSVSDAGPAFVASELAAARGPFRAPGPELARLQTTQPVPLLLEQLAHALDHRLDPDATKTEHWSTHDPAVDRL